MMDKNSLGRSDQAKQKKLIGFIHWPIWVILIRKMIIEKDVQDIVSIGPCPIRKANKDWNKENKDGSNGH